MHDRFGGVQAFLPLLAREVAQGGREVLPMARLRQGGEGGLVAAGVFAPDLAAQFGPAGLAFLGQRGQPLAIGEIGPEQGGRRRAAWGVVAFFMILPCKMR
ncbi:hypothetical protein [Bordetella hinzii]|uniref:hypothetical protein n=1 Tax=Bordetella hinzii TaxID=103855 RepID=UPI001F3EC469|nr:hypothetical protein [Bordetella hinzii]